MSDLLCTYNPTHIDAPALLKPEPVRHRPSLVGEVGAPPLTMARPAASSVWIRKRDRVAAR